ncbi:MAG: glycosyltransferase [Bryobacterales bacterium]|nr:glycosyltransferase [Bryobacterales bacterium]
MKLAVISHKECWPLAGSPSGYATDGGFPLQMKALSELFSSTVLVVPVHQSKPGSAVEPLTGNSVSVRPLSILTGVRLRRRVNAIGWLASNLRVLLAEMWRADAVHVAIPGDVGTIGLVVALALRKPMFVRYCGNWNSQKSRPQRFCRWFMETFAGGRRVMLATGGADQDPSPRNSHVRWIFATSLRSADLTNARPRQLRDPRGARLIVVCRQEKGKGVEHVIAGLPDLIHRFSNIRLDVVGDGSALSTFKQLAQSRGVSAHVHFHGHVRQSEVSTLLEQADLFCLPSASEGFPKSVIEAMASGLPVVTTPVSVLPSLVARGGGILLSEVSGRAVAAAVTECLSDPERYAAMSKSAIATARCYSLETWRDTIGGYLREAWGHGSL